MQCNQIDVLKVLAHQFGDAMRHVAMRSAVESVAAHVVFLVEFVGHGVEIGVRRHRRVEGVVEHRHLRHVGHQVVHGADAFQVACIVDGREVAEAFDACFHAFVHEATLFKQVAALHDAVADGVDFVEALDGTVFFAEQLLEHEIHAFLVVGHVVHQDFLLAVGQREFQEGVVEADALHAALRQYGFVVHIVQFVLDGT